MNEETIEERLRRVIVDTNGTNPGELTLDSTFDDLGFDELDSVELVMAVEKEFDLELPDEEWQELESGTIRKILEHVTEKLRVRELRSLAKGPAMSFSEAARLDTADRKRAEGK